MGEETNDKQKCLSSAPRGGENLSTLHPNIILDPTPTLPPPPQTLSLVLTLDLTLHLTLSLPLPTLPLMLSLNQALVQTLG